MSNLSKAGEGSIEKASIPPGHLFAELATQGTFARLQTSMATQIERVISSNISSAGLLAQIPLLDGGEQVSEFSKEVAEYATSSDVVIALGNEIGKPRPIETEDEFVERASLALRIILRRKFKV